MSKTSILLADDNSSVLDQVRRMLERDERFRIVASVKDGDAVLPAWSRAKPDVIILDISMGNVSGIDVAMQLQDSGCLSKIIFLTVHEDRDFLNAAMGAGGSAYVVKSRLSQDLVTAIHAVLSDKVFVSPNMLFTEQRP